MARGAPDYSNVRAGDDLHRVDDLAEIPPRLGQVSSIDRAGEVVAIEDFRYGLVGVETAVDGLGSSVTASPLFTRFGGFSAKLARVANSNAWTRVEVFTPALASERIGAEIQFCADTADPIVRLYISQYTGSEVILWGLKWNAVLDKIYIGDDTTGWTEIASGYDIAQGYHSFHNMKLVADVTNKDYERVFVNGVPLTVADVSAQSGANTVAPHVVVYVQNYGGTPNANEIYLDYVIITRNEP
jgi:hypothetical protein